MAKSIRRSSRQKQSNPDDYTGVIFDSERTTRAHLIKPLQPLNPRQSEYLQSITNNDITFGLGPAGTGKTYVATAWAAEAIKAREYSTLVITRPAVEAGESIGFLPGQMSEKFDPYFAPVREVLFERLGKSNVEAMIRSERIVIMPLAFMRGSSFKNSIVILDEAQNTSPKQMKMFLTRLGQDSKMIINGDIKQSDISGPNGLADATHKLHRLPGVSFVEFSRDDIVRHGLIRKIIDRYEKDDITPYHETRARNYIAAAENGAPDQTEFEGWGGGDSAIPRFLTG